MPDVVMPSVVDVTHRDVDVGGVRLHTLIRAGSGPTADWTSAELDTYAAVLRDPRQRQPATGRS